jgi:adenosylmethionine-8-amino-7-oxononanoate aminotransferase
VILRQQGSVVTVCPPLTLPEADASVLVATVHDCVATAAKNRRAP